MPFVIRVVGRLFFSSVDAIAAFRTGLPELEREEQMRQFIITLILVISVGALAYADDYIRIDSDSVGAATAADTVSQASCDPPVITNKPPNDTLVADNCNELTYQFEADPGGVGGNGSVYWDLFWGYGNLDSASGLYTFQEDQANNYPIMIRVVNDCSPPKADTCFYTVRAETEKEVVKRVRDGLPTHPIDRARYVFGPAEAESVGVWIETNGSTAELEAMGIKFRPAARHNVYTAGLSIEEYSEIKTLKSIVRVTLMGTQDIAWSTAAILSPKSPDLDTSTAYFFADSAKALYGTACQPPVITNKPPNDTLVADNCNALTYQFQADPGGVGGNGSVYWELMGGAGFGDIDSLTGLYTFQADQMFNYQMQIQVVNNCSPAKADTCFFIVRAETEKEVVKKERDGLPTQPWERARYVFGPAEAESVGVWIETNGSTAELEAIGIKLGSPRRSNLYTATLSVKEYIEVKKLKSVIKISLMQRGGGVQWSLDIQPLPLSPDLDTSTAYFFADSARALYGVDSALTAIRRKKLLHLSNDE